MALSYRKRLLFMHMMGYLLYILVMTVPPVVKLASRMSVLPRQCSNTVFLRMARIYQDSHASLPIFQFSLNCLLPGTTLAHTEHDTRHNTANFVLCAESLAGRRRESKTNFLFRCDEPTTLLKWTLWVSCRSSLNVISDIVRARVYLTVSGTCRRVLDFVDFQKKDVGQEDFIAPVCWHEMEEKIQVFS